MTGSHANDLIDALTCVGEGKRIAAALESAGRRHATNVGITAHRIHGSYKLHEEPRDIGEIILFSYGGAWRARRYEIHIPVEIDPDTDSVMVFDENSWRKDAFLVTSSGDGEGMYPYRAPAVAAWNALRWAIIHIGQLRACEEGLVKVWEVGGYEEPANRDEKSLDEYFELGWEIVQPILEKGFNGPALVARNLVMQWNDEATEPHTPEVWEICPGDCESAWEHDMCSYDIAPLATQREDEESEYVSDIPDLTDPRPICIQISGWPRWSYEAPYPPKERTWDYQQEIKAAEESRKQGIVEAHLNGNVEMEEIGISDGLNKCFGSTWFYGLVEEALDGAPEIHNIRMDGKLTGADYYRAIAEWTEIVADCLKEDEPEILRRAYYVANEVLYVLKTKEWTQWRGAACVNVPKNPPSVEVTRRIFEALNAH